MKLVKEQDRECRFYSGGAYSSQECMKQFSVLKDTLFINYLKFTQPISHQCSISITPENIRELLLFWRFRGV